ncbi:transcriptional regulator with XRE-family HTH domain [Salinibacterium sp. CAN_S4]|uniref:helix-turn-helix domain-containing protein n=1 Tax=Salinibacterium sp. CAN_S4 TaxID=2787727 RepID=UPI0018EF58E6
MLDIRQGALIQMDNLGSRLKDIRLKSGMTLRELARQADVSPSFISQIENGKSQPSVATLYAFAQLLKVSVDDLFENRPAVPDAPAAVFDADSMTRGDLRNPSDAWLPSEYANRVSVVHPAHRSHLDMAAGVEWERLAATPERSVNFMKISYAPGAASTDGGEMLSHDGYEYGFVTQGTLEVTIGDETFTLHPEESLGFDSSIPHSFRNAGTEVMTGVWFVHGKCQ